MKTEPREITFSVPLRRTRWVSFRVGVGAVVAAALLAATSVAALAGVLIWLKVHFDGFWVIFLFSLLWFGLFFLSYPLQRRYARAHDVRRPGINLIDGKLTVPLTPDSTLHFKLDEPHELAYGWWEHVMFSAHPNLNRTRAVWTHAMLSQNGQQVFFIAEDAVREAQAAGWPKNPDSSTPSMPHAATATTTTITTTTIPRVSLWASDLVALVEAIRHTPPTPR